MSTRKKALSFHQGDRGFTCPPLSRLCSLHCRHPSGSDNQQLCRNRTHARHNTDPLLTRGYVTTAVVAILAVLSLLATRVTIGVTVDAYRVAGFTQGATATLYGAEVSLKDSVARIASNLTDLASNPSCFNHNFGTVSVTDSDTGLSRDFQMQYYAEYIETRNSRDLYRVYALADSGAFKATVSQIASVDTSAGTVYLLPGTWSDTMQDCS